MGELLRVAAATFSAVVFKDIRVHLFPLASPSSLLLRPAASEYNLELSNKSCSEKFLTAKFV